MCHKIQKLKELSLEFNNEQYMEKYGELASELIKLTTNFIPIGIVNFLRMKIQENTKVTYTSNLFFNDLVTMIKTKKIIDLGKYTYLDTDKDTVLNTPLEITILKNSYHNIDRVTEIQILFYKMGIKKYASFLRTLYNILENNKWL